MSSLIERHTNQIVGVLSCFDCMVIQGLLPTICHHSEVAAQITAMKKELRKLRGRPRRRRRR